MREREERHSRKVSKVEEKGLMGIPLRPSITVGEREKPLLPSALDAS
jgi:hypothetical protein